MAELEKVEIDKPCLELILDTFDAFRQKHPWVDADGIAPKSVAREILEKGMSFHEYVKEYGLARSEGALLRYLSDAYKALVQNVPENTKTDELYDLTDELGALVRNVDSSLIDEWERLSNPEALVARLEKGEPEEEMADVTRDRRAFTAMVRNACYRLVRALALGRYDEAADAVEAIEGEPGWSPDRLASALAPYFEAHAAIRTDAAARSPTNTIVEEHERAWEVRQILVDPEDELEWSILARVDLDRARREGAPVLELRAIGPS
jgi:hypothetical protein